MITAIKYPYAPVVNHFSKKITYALLPSAEITLASVKNDTFIKSKLSASLCAESFFIRPLFAKALKKLSKKDIYNLQPILNTKRKTVSIPNNPLVTNLINKFINKVPEIYFVFRPKTNEPDLAQHAISTLRQVLIHPEYKNLSTREQNILHLCALSHDIGKALISEPRHAEASATIIAKRLAKVDMPEADKNLVIKIIENHHYSYNIKFKHKTYNDYAKIFSEKEFKLLKMFTDADIKSKKVSMKNLYRRLENKFIFRTQQNQYKKAG